MAPHLVRIVARASSRMFGGLALSKNEAWLNVIINFATDSFAGTQKLKSFPAWLRPLIVLFIPEFWRIKGYHKTARQAVIPLLRERRELGEKPDDFLQWMSDNAEGEENDQKFLAFLQLQITFAAIHTSAAAPMQALYDLCVRPEYIAPLREEIESVMEEYGALNSKRGLSKLVKLDSFMKESQRFSPLLLSKILFLLSLAGSCHLPALTLTFQLP